jgi:hypothetical protein
LGKRKLPEQKNAPLRYGAAGLSRLDVSDT